MRNSNPQFFFIFFEGIMPTLRRDSKTGPGFAFRLPPQHSRFSAKLVTIVTVTVHAHHRKRRSYHSSLQHELSLSKIIIYKYIIISKSS